MTSLKYLLPAGYYRELVFAMKTIIYLVRHGEVHNPEQVIYGRMPGFSLSAKGKRQAHTLGKFLSSHPVSVIYTSPLSRARETASIISSYHDNVQVLHDPLLLEVNSPQFEGRSFREAEEMGWYFYQEKYYSLGQERKEDLSKRMHVAIENVRRKHKGKSAVMVSHGDPIMIAVSQLLGEPFLSWGTDVTQRRKYVRPAEGFRLVFDASGAPEVSKLNILST
jgi:broad specificity phosphatase PhoE